MNDMVDAMKSAARIVILGSVVLPAASTAHDIPVRDMPAPARSIPRDAEFTFSRTWIDIKARDSMVPRVDRSTITSHAALNLVDQFHVGRTDSLGRLRRLETWDRHTIETLPMTKSVASKPLSDYELPRTGRGAASLAPLFFVEHESDWRQVAPSELTGEKRFIRLRWLKSVRDETFEKDAALVMQSLSFIEHFEYDGGGALVSVVRQRREHGYARENAVIHGR
jgi:hypothetical protein